MTLKRPLEKEASLTHRLAPIYEQGGSTAQKYDQPDHSDNGDNSQNDADHPEHHAFSR